MKTVFTNDMLLHVYVQQNQPHGRSSSMRFDGDTLYSYSTPIARIVKSRRGPSRSILLVTAHTYSVTTSGHISRLFRAWGWDRGNDFRATSLGLNAGRHSEGPSGYTGKIDHHTNLRYLSHLVTDEAKRLKRARDRRRDHLHVLHTNATNYAATFGLKLRLSLETVVSDLSAHEAARERRLNTPAALKRRARAAADREADREKREAFDRLARAEREREQRADISAWLAGENVYLSYAAQRLEDGSAMLRLKPSDPSTIETSMGAEVPYTAGHALYTTLSASVAGLIRPPDRIIGQRVGSFTVDALWPDGSFRAGCHFFSWAEVSRFAATVGWTS